MSKPRQRTWFTCVVGAAVFLPAMTASTVTVAQAPFQDHGTAASTEAPAESEEDRFGFVAVPVVAYFPEAGAVVGAFASPWFRFEDSPDADKDPPSRVQIVAGYTSRGQLGLEVRPQLFFDHQRFGIEGQLEYLDRDIDFYGVGNDVASQPESYESHTVGVETEATMKLHSAMYLGVVQDFHVTRVDDIAPDGMLATDPLSGRNGSRTSGLGASFAWDNRDNPVAARRGTFAKFAALLYQDFFGSQHNYVLAKLDVRHFVPTYRQQVLALRGYAEMRTGDVPFDRMGQLGGPNMLRGYYKGRYRDQHVMAVEAEYRLPLVWRFGLVAFAGIGQVQSNLAKVAFADMRPSGGAGVRFMLDNDQRLNARFDVGVTPDEANFYLSVGEAF